MTDIDLSTINARLRWAGQHAQSVNEIVAEWGESALRIDESADRARGVRVYRAEVVAAPPVEVALALGDLLQQSRATLDNLIGVLRGGATSTSAFRIDSDPRSFDMDPLRPRGQLAGVPGWALDQLRTIQPFPGNELGHVGIELDRLHRLAILDRHRALILRAGIIDVDNAWASTSRPGSTAFSLSPDGTVLTVEYPPDSPTHPRVRATVLVPEPTLALPEYPFFHTAPQVAGIAIWLVGRVLWMMREAAARQAASPG